MSPLWVKLNCVWLHYLRRRIFQHFIIHNNFIYLSKIIIFQSSYKIIKKVQKESGRGFRKMDILKMSNFEKGSIIFFGKMWIFDFTAFCSKFGDFVFQLFA